jgi:hypothetical protein
MESKLKLLLNQNRTEGLIHEMSNINIQSRHRIWKQQSPLKQHPTTTLLSTTTQKVKSKIISIVKGRQVAVSVHYQSPFQEDGN